MLPAPLAGKGILFNFSFPVKTLGNLPVALSCFYFPTLKRTLEIGLSAYFYRVKVRLSHSLALDSNQMVRRNFLLGKLYKEMCGNKSTHWQNEKSYPIFQ